jgi:antitoxin YefM
VAGGRPPLRRDSLGCNDALAPPHEDVYAILYTFGEVPVTRPRLAQDIQPLADFRAHLATVVRRVQRTRRPVVLTQHGRGAAVLVDVRDYDALLERVELLEDVQAAEKQLARGRAVAHSRAKRSVLGRLG